MTLKSRRSFTTMRTEWLGVLCGSRWTGPSGVAFYSDDEGTKLLEYRDDQGLLRGVLCLYGSGELLLMTDPKFRRRGICTSLLQEADRQGFDINFDRQAYTRAGYLTVKKFLRLNRVQQEEVTQ